MNDRIHCLDGLRAFSILLVMAGHFTKMTIIPAGFGVTVFFVVSGFIITHLLLKEVGRTGTIDMVAFYRRRVFRLVPAIVVCLIGTWVAQGYVGKDWVDLPRALASLFFFQNYYVGIEPFQGPLTQHWSLAVEEHFYLIYPMFLLFLIRERIQADMALLLVCITCLVIRVIYTQAAGDWEPQMVEDVIYRHTETRVDSILWGCILAILSRAKTKEFRTLCKPHNIMIGIFLLFIGKASGSPAFEYTDQPLGAMLIMAPILFGTGPVVQLARWILNHPASVFLGKISFSLYLWHTIAFHVTRVSLGGDPSWWVLMPAATATSIIAAYLSYRYVELPFINYGRRTHVYHQSRV